MSGDAISIRVIESLRLGIPPKRGVRLYSVGNEKLIEGITKYHLSGIKERGNIRFISGSWGSGKTHLFRLLRDIAYEQNCLVSNVELDTTSTALNKFEQIFYAIVRQISSKRLVDDMPDGDIAPFGSVILEALHYLGTGTRRVDFGVTPDQFQKAYDQLMENRQIDIDFKKIVQEYWRTYLPEAGEAGALEQKRGELLQWLGGDGTIGNYRKRYGVAKMVGRQNAKLMLQSLAGFVHLSGYAGLMIMFDEAEQAYSVMRKAALQDAHNNLLSTINNIDSTPGLFLVYATTPDFYTHPKHGIVIYPPLSTRLGKPTQKAPRALDTIWNIDAIEPNLQDYQSVAVKIKNVYADAYPDSAGTLPADDDIKRKAEDLQKLHPPAAPLGFWRVLVTAIIDNLDDNQSGDFRTTEKIYDDVMDRLREA